jgi:hypothetical protein
VVGRYAAQKHGIEHGPQQCHRLRSSNMVNLCPSITSIAKVRSARSLRVFFFVYDQMMK